MQFDQNSTIVAQATAIGESGIAVVRISGNKSQQIMQQVFKSKHSVAEFESHKMYYGTVVNHANEIIDQVMAVYMKAPFTYTREDVVEIQCHGSQIIVSAIIRAIQSYGARMAEPGEFTYRAFINGRIDLTQAEAINQLIKSKSYYAMKSSIQQVNGSARQFYDDIRKELYDIQGELVASLDFPDEYDDIITKKSILQKCHHLITILDQATNEKRIKIINSSAKAVLIGLPNAGKSTILNRLIGYDRAIVTDIPGTTRDLITDYYQYKGINVQITDTAGIRETNNQIEKIGIQKALNVIDESDIKIYVIDNSQPDIPEFIYSPDLIILTKCDICSDKHKFQIIHDRNINENIPIIMSSMDDSKIIEIIKNAIYDKIITLNDINDHSFFITQERQHEKIVRIINELRFGIESIENGLYMDILSSVLTECINTLSSITGENESEEMISYVFNKFCFGK